MSEKVQMTEEQAREIYFDCVSEIQITTEGMFLNGLKSCGYIPLNPVEEADDMWETYQEARKCFPDNSRPTFELVNKLYEAIQHLKQQLEAR